MIRELELTNFRSFRSAKIPLQRLSVIVGPNASGKSSLLTAIDLAMKCGAADPREILSGDFAPDALRSHGTDEILRIDLAFGTDRSTRRSGVAVASARSYVGKVDTPVDSLEVEYRDDDGPRLRIDGEPVIELEVWRARNEFEHHPGRAAFLRFDASTLGDASYSSELEPRLQSNGEGLAAVLADLAIRRPKALQAIIEDLTRVIPTVRALHLERARVVRTQRETGAIEGRAVAFVSEQEYWGHRVLLDLVGAERVGAPAISEGTLLVLGLLTTLHLDPRPSVLLIDDIDRALHPKALGDLVARIRALQASDPDLQIICTSHSPYLLDHFDYAEILVTTTRDDGSSVCAPLSRHPELPRWRDLMRPGEFWSSVGEAWARDESEPQMEAASGG